MESRQITARRNHLTDHATLSRDEIHYAIGQAGLLENLHQEIVRMDRRSRGFPYRHVAHHSRSHIQVGSDRRKVERREREHETFQGTVFHTIQYTRLGIRLIGIYLTSIESAETQEIDQFARSVNLRLERILTLSQHNRSIQYITIFRSQQLGNTKHNGRTFHPWQLRPFLMRFHGGIDSHLHFFLARLMVSSQYVMMVMRHNDLTGITRTDLFSTNYQRNIPFLGTNLRQRFL